MAELVFDTEPLIAFLYDEPGHGTVADLLSDVDEGDADGALAEVNATELFYLIARIEGDDGRPTSSSLRVADRDVRALSQRGLAVRRADWRRAGEVKSQTPISLGDAHAVALADERDATLVVGGDDDFEELPVDVDVRSVREGGV